MLGGCAFLDGHPEFSRRFRELPLHARDDAPTFAAAFHDLYHADQRRLDEQWQLFVANLDYGYDLQREAVVYQPVSSHDDNVVVAQVRANRGWQLTGVQVTAGTTYTLRASGRYQIASQPKIWWCEPGGVTIRYYQGAPLGMLLAGVSDQSRPLSGITALARPVPIGLRRELQFTESGTLFLRINESPAELADNAGQLQVEISSVTP